MPSADAEAMVLIQFSKSMIVIASQRVGAKRRPMTGSAKQSMQQQKSKGGSLRFRNDVETHFRDPAAGFARGLACSFRSSCQRAQGMPDARRVRSRVRSGRKHTR
jgi:hypothetical protein